MTRAIFDGVVIAESDDVRNVEGMTYLPIGSVDFDALVESQTTSRCFWKGKASYWHVQGDKKWHRTLRSRTNIRGRSRDVSSRGASRSGRARGSSMTDRHPGARFGRGRIR